MTDRLDVARVWDRGGRAEVRRRRVRLRAALEAARKRAAARREPEDQIMKWRVQQYRDRIERSIREIEAGPRGVARVHPSWLTGHGR